MISIHKDLGDAVPKKRPSEEHPPRSSLMDGSNYVFEIEKMEEKKLLLKRDETFGRRDHPGKDSRQKASSPYNLQTSSVKKSSPSPEIRTV